MKPLTEKSKLWQYFSHNFVAIDQLGNALIGGNADNTISARVGYYNHYYEPFLNGNVPWYWKRFEKIIDTTFYPVDGPGHCHEAYHNDPGEFFDYLMTDKLLPFASGIILISCLFIAPCLYIITALGIVKQKKIDRASNLHKRIKSVNFILKSTRREIDEHKWQYIPSEFEDELTELQTKVDQIKLALKKKSASLS